jgi:hypothetical protein
LSCPDAARWIRACPQGLIPQKIRFTLEALIDLIGSAVLVYGGEDVDGEVALQVVGAVGLIVPDRRRRVSLAAPGSHVRTLRSFVPSSARVMRPPRSLRRPRCCHERRMCSIAARVRPDAHEAVQYGHFA